MSVYIGIDPGISPALVALDDKGALLWMKDIPAIKVGDKNEMNGAAIRDVLIGADHVFLEKAQAMPAERFDKVSGKIVKAGYLINGPLHEISRYPRRYLYRFADSL